MREGQRIGFDRRVRPLRVGYRVDPRRGDEVLRAIETATAQWGGLFHVVVPAFQRRPAWWTVPFGTPPTASMIESGYADAFECDYVVDARSGVTEKATYRTITFDMLRRVAGHDGIEAGLPALAVWRDYWLREGRFRPERARPIAAPVAPESLRLFSAACFGALTNATDLADPAAAFAELFSPATPALDPETLLDGIPWTAAHPYVSPLSLGSWRLAVAVRGWRHRHLKIMLIDPASPSDILDFWNLRATGTPIVPVPTIWSTEIAPHLVERLKKRPDDIEGDWIEVVGARRTPAETVKGFAAELSELGLRISRAIYPPMADLASAMVTELEDETEEAVRDGRIRLELLTPRAASRYHGGHIRWMNLFSHSRWRVPGDGSVATLIPSELGQVRDLFGALGPLDVRATSEGVATPSGSRREHVDLDLPSGRDVLAALFRARGFDPRRSDPGSIAERLISQSGGLHWTAVFQHWNLLKLLNSAARADAVLPVDDAQGRRELRASFFKPGDLKAAFNKDLENDRQRTNVMRTLVTREIIRTGLTLSCDECGYTNWVELGNIAKELTCERCLQRFPFPHASPPGSERWAYRPTGACSVPDFASGSYTVALSLLFLEPDHDRMTWCTGTQLSPKLEVDFGAVLEDRDADTPSTTLVLGEAKSTNNFTAQDFERAHELRKHFPDATLVMATLKSELTDEEKRGIRQLARPSPRRLSEVQWHPRVLVLTRLELLAREGARHCWNGTPHQSRQGQFVGIPEIETWSDTTLQLHTGLGPHLQWAEAEAERLRSRTRRSR